MKNTLQKSKRLVDIKKTAAEVKNILDASYITKSPHDPNFYEVDYNVHIYIMYIDYILRNFAKFLNAFINL